MALHDHRRQRPGDHYGHHPEKTHYIPAAQSRGEASHMRLSWMPHALGRLRPRPQRAMGRWRTHHRGQPRPAMSPRPHRQAQRLDARPSPQRRPPMDQPIRAHLPNRRKTSIRPRRSHMLKTNKLPGGSTTRTSAFPLNSLCVTKLPALESGTCITSDNTKQRCIRCR